LADITANLKSTRRIAQRIPASAVRPVNPGSDGWGGFGWQSVRRHEIVGKRVPQRHRCNAARAARSYPDL
jgi:hypothetical protein